VKRTKIIQDGADDHQDYRDVGLGFDQDGLRSSASIGRPPPVRPLRQIRGPRGRHHPLHRRRRLTRHLLHSHDSRNSGNFITFPNLRSSLFKTYISKLFILSFNSNIFYAVLVHRNPRNSSLALIWNSISTYLFFF